jgi:DNA-binding beta-propeller fold protein YncE
VNSISQIACRFGLAVVAATGIGGGSLRAQGAPDPNAAPNPYHMLDFSIQLPEGRKLGSPIGVEIDHSDGKTLWILDRCGGDACIGSNLAPIMKIDATGKVVANFGAGLINWPHGFYVDRDGDVWATDARADGAKGHTVIKFAPDGRVLMTLGKPGVAGSAPGMFNAPSDVLIAPNGDIFVADGHGILLGQPTNDRIVKFDKHGKFIITWGQARLRPRRV